MLHEVPERLGITRRVRAALLNFIKDLNNELQKQAPDMSVAAVRVTGCSLTRGLMLPGSDIDDMTIYVRNIPKSAQPGVQLVAERMFSRIEGIKTEGANELPAVRNFDDYEAEEQTYAREGKQRITVYDGGEELSLVSAPKALLVSRFPCKHSSRVLLLLLRGEQSAAESEEVAGCFPVDSPVREQLLESIQCLEQLRLSPAAMKYSKALDEAYNRGERHFTVSPEEQDSFAQSVGELCERGLIALYRDKLVLMWHLNGVRWGESFWRNAISVEPPLPEFRSRPFVERGTAISTFGAKPPFILTEHDHAALVRAPFDSAFSGAEATRLLGRIGNLPGLATVLVMDLVREHYDVLEPVVRDAHRQALALPDIERWNTPSAEQAHVLTRLVMHRALVSPEKAKDVALYLLDTVALRPDAPEYLLYPVLQFLARNAYTFGDEHVENLTTSAGRLHRHRPYPWISDISGKLELLDQAHRDLVLQSREEVRALLTEHPVLTVYNKAYIEAVSVNGSARLNSGVNSVSSPSQNLIQVAGSGIIIARAKTDIEKAIAASGKLVRADEQTWISYVQIPDVEYQEYYFTVCNPYLWLLNHEMLEQLPEGAIPSLSDIERGFRDYRKVNKCFAEELVQLLDLAPAATVVCHDYHLHAVASLVREKTDRGTLVFCLHTPWPSVDYFKSHTSPLMAKRTLDWLLSFDRVAFHIPQYASAFLDACESMTDGAVDRRGLTVERDEHTLSVCVNPISNDFDAEQDLASHDTCISHARQIKAQLGSRMLIARAERSELTKGLPEGLHAFRQLLREHPELRGRVCYASWVIPDRLAIPCYQANLDAVKALAREINAEFDPGCPFDGVLEAPAGLEQLFAKQWPSVVVNTVPDPNWMGLMEAADVLLVNSFRDGMNLVAKTFVNLNDPKFQETYLAGNPGVAVMSRTIGAYTELAGHVIGIDPYSQRSITDGLFAALSLSSEERQEKAAGAWAAIRNTTLLNWTHGILKSDQ